MSTAYIFELSMSLGKQGGRLSDSHVLAGRWSPSGQASLMPLGHSHSLVARALFSVFPASDKYVTSDGCVHLITPGCFGHLYSTVSIPQYLHPYLYLSLYLPVLVLVLVPVPVPVPCARVSILVDATAVIERQYSCATPSPCINLFQPFPLRVFRILQFASLCPCNSEA